MYRTMLLVSMATLLVASSFAQIPGQQQGFTPQQFGFQYPQAGGFQAAPQVQDSFQQGLQPAETRAGAYPFQQQAFPGAYQLPAQAYQGFPQDPSAFQQDFQQQQQ